MAVQLHYGPNTKLLGRPV